MSEEQIQNLLFAQEMNYQRLKMRDFLERSHEINSAQLNEVLLKMQHLMYQNKDIIEMGEELEKNTVNLMRIMNWQHTYGANSNEGSDQKYNVNFEDELTDILENQFNDGSRHFTIQQVADERMEKIEVIKPVMK